MEAPPIDSLATQERTEGVTQASQAIGVVAHIIRNQWEETVAVHMPNALDPTRLDDIAQCAVKVEPASAETLASQLRLVLPADIHSGHLYPAEIVPLIDAVVQGATGDPDTLAFWLNGEAKGPWIGTGPLHFDAPGATKNYEVSKLQGFNINLTLLGEGEAQFGAVRSWESVEQIRAMVQHANRHQTDPLVDSRHIAEVICSSPNFSLSEPVKFKAGDILAFQAAMQLPDHLPVAHVFRPSSSDRSYAVFSPLAGIASKVLQARQKTAKQYDIAAYGYR